MFKKLLSSLLAVLLLLSCCTVAMAAGDTPDFQIKTLETTIDSITVGIYTCEDAAPEKQQDCVHLPGGADFGLRRGDFLPEEEGITDLDTSKAGTVFLCLGQRGGPGRNPAVGAQIPWNVREFLSGGPQPARAGRCHGCEPADSFIASSMCRMQASGTLRPSTRYMKRG